MIEPDFASELRRIGLEPSRHCEGAEQHEQAEGAETPASDGTPADQVTARDVGPTAPNLVTHCCSLPSRRLQHERSSRMTRMITTSKPMMPTFYLP